MGGGGGFWHGAGLPAEEGVVLSILTGAGRASSSHHPSARPRRCARQAVPGVKEPVAHG
ncbi:hypothetical protein SSAG_02748 [Streptomyces sp. Mg1]|nr:hypothetical protein SSAG_02748 [Streptomyces sp. Mg1]